MARRRHEVTDREWAIIEPLLRNRMRGTHRVDDRRVLNGILWRFRSGSPWADIPERYGSSMTCYNRFVRWCKAGVWDQLLLAVSAGMDGGSASVGPSQWDGPVADLPTHSMLLSTLRDVLSTSA